MPQTGHVSLGIRVSLEAELETLAAVGAPLLELLEDVPFRFRDIN